MTGRINGAHMAGDASWNSSVANIEQPILLREHLDEIANEVGDCPANNGYLVSSKRLKKDQSTKRFRCDYEGCEKAFGKSDHLKTHIRTHTGERPYKCANCDKGFSDLANLKRHNRIHTGHKPFKCDECGKTFAVSSNLKQHKRTHTGDRPYSCHFCDKTFSHVSSRRKHLLQHGHDTQNIELKSPSEDVATTADNTSYEVIGAAVKDDEKSPKKRSTPSQYTDPLCSYIRNCSDTLDVNNNRNRENTHKFASTIHDLTPTITELIPEFIEPYSNMPPCMHTFPYLPAPHMESSPPTSSYLISSYGNPFSTQNLHCFTNTSSHRREISPQKAAMNFTYSPNIGLMNQNFIDQPLNRPFHSPSPSPVFGVADRKPISTCDGLNECITSTNFRSAAKHKQGDNFLAHTEVAPYFSHEDPFTPVYTPNYPYPTFLTSEIEKFDSYFYLAPDNTTA